MNNIYSKIVGVGAYLPEKILTNDDLSKIVETNDEWITQRTGIKIRHIAAENEFTSDMAVKAAQIALEQAKLIPTDIDLIIVATTSPDKTFPATATMVQSKLGIKKGAAFDVQAVCAGFIYALSIADMFIKTGNAKNVLVMGAEKMSSLLDWSDRGTCILFGDGAGAFILTASEKPGIIGFSLASDGDYLPILYTDGGAGSSDTSGKVRMKGAEVMKHAVEKMTSISKELLTKSKLNSEDIDLVVPHQANIRIIEAVANRLSMPMDKILTTVDHHANTSAASIPLAFAEGIDTGKIKPGQKILMTAIGGGLAWGAALLEY